MLYLENRLSDGVFTPERTQMTELLTLQAAISLQNARLVEGMKQAEEALRRSKEELELRVRQRTEALALANSRLERDITRRKRAEEMVKAERKRFKYPGTDTIYLVLPRLLYPLVNRFFRSVLVKPVTGDAMNTLARISPARTAEPLKPRRG